MPDVRFLNTRSRFSSLLSSTRYRLTSLIQCWGQCSRLSIDWIQRNSRQPAHCPRLLRGLHHVLDRWILWGSQRATWSRQYVRVLVLVRKSCRLKLPSIFFCIGERELKRNGKHDLTLCSRRWVHHLDIFQEPRVIIRRRLRCRMVSTVNVLEMSADRSTVLSGIYPVIRECSIRPLCTDLINDSIRSQHYVSASNGPDSWLFPSNNS